MKGRPMSFGSIVGWIVCGLVVGLLARLLVPGRQSMTLPVTALLGIGGAMVGGVLYSLVRGRSVAPFSFSEHNWYGWGVAVLGAMLLIWAYPIIVPRKWYN